MDASHAQEIAQTVTALSFIPAAFWAMKIDIFGKGEPALNVAKWLLIIFGVPIAVHFIATYIIVPTFFPG